MRDYIIQRLALFVPVLVLVSLAIFIITHILPGDVARVVLMGPSGQGIVTTDQLRDVRQKLGLDRSLPVQYLDWVKGLLTVDLGVSYVSQQPITKLLAQRLPLTFELAVLSIVISLAFALPMGILAALHQDTWLDYALRVFSIGGLTMPSFWTGSLLLLALVGVFGWIPPVGYVAFWHDPWRNIQQIVFPVLIMGYLNAAVVSRMTRSTLLEVLRQDYLRTAWAKGLRERVIVTRHALRNAILPVITISGFQFGNLLGGTVVMEYLFSLPGIGSALLDAIGARDLPVIQNVVLLIALWFLLINLAVDLLYAWFDPRVRYAE